MRTLLFSSLVALGFVSACDRKKTDEVTVEPAPKPIETTETPSTTPPAATTTTTPATPSATGTPSTATPAPVDSTLDIESERTALSRSIEERTAALDAKIDALEKRGDEKSRETVATLRAKRDQARAKLNDLGTRTQENWQAFKKDVSDSWDQLERDVNEATR